MKFYNKIMLYFWLFVAAFLFIAVTYLCIMEGFRKWGFYYLFVGLTVFMYFMRRWMMKRMDRHMQYLEEQKKNNDN